MKLLATITALALFSGTVAYAAGPHSHADKPLHGGVVAEARDIDFELVAQKDKLRLYLRDHGKKVDVSNATATLTLLNGADKQEVALVPQGEWLGAAGEFKVTRGTKVVALVKQSGKTVTIRFVLP
ncbi:MAG: hypothetical protein A2Z93_12680 [Curvibacter sp. GWA2_64_110]|nr:MAG: hypothetical protein A2Z93_12680 [Curvibacter sp. GWA2_64_110]HCY14601.1 hypothetical protein [Curvibacter sp.]